MNLMTQTIENIYKNGNAILQFNENPNWKVIFYVGEHEKLKIRIYQNFGDNFIETFDVDTKEGLSYICLLLYYSFCNQARKNDLVYLTSDEKQFNSEMSMTAINELYHQLIPLMSVEKNNIECFAKCNSNTQIYNFFAYQSKYTDSAKKILSIRDIMESLIYTYENFENKAINAKILWKEIGNSSSKKEWNDAANNWNDFLNKLYINQFSDSSKINLSNLKIDYEFLTSKNYNSNPAINCEEEIENLEIAVLTPSKSTLLVGPPGVGKTAIVEGLAYKIILGQVSPSLQNKKILKINTSSIVKGCSLVGMFEEKVEKIMQYLIENPDTILFIDEIHTTIGAGLGSKGNLDLANIMKPYIDRGEVKVIGATTEEEYEEYIKQDKAFNRRFKKITISEPEKSVICEIIKETIKKLEKTTNIKWVFDNNISKIIINHIAECTDEKNRVYNDKRYNPDISLTILETAFAIALFIGEDCVSIENISDAIRKSEFLYESVRTSSANNLLNTYHYFTPKEHKSKIIQFKKPQN